MYGEIRPIAADRIEEAEDGQWFDFAGRSLQAFYTEGHARHHYCLHDPASQGVFSGDSFGLSYRQFDTAAGEFIMPSTTPVHFDPVEAHRSIELIMGREPRQVYLTHYSRVRDLDRLAADMHECIDDYVALAEEHAVADDRADRLRAAMFDYLVQRLEAHGYRADRDTMWALLELDVNLNTQGLEVWLDRRA